LQQCVSDRSGIEALAGGAQAATAPYASQLQLKVCILLQEACTTALDDARRRRLEMTRTSRYSITSLRLLHDHYYANLIGLSRDLCMLLTVMSTSGGASALGIQAAPQRVECASCVGEQFLVRIKPITALLGLIGPQPQVGMHQVSRGFCQIIECIPMEPSAARG